MPTSSKTQPRYKRVLLKLSGEALGGEAGAGIEPEVLKHYCDEIEAAHREGIKLAVVLGGGNLFRGAVHDRILRNLSGYNLVCRSRAKQ